jgi:hypothetical protein
MHAGDPLYRDKAGEPPVLYRKPVSGGTRSACLEMSAWSDAEVSYSLRGDESTSVDLKADWADTRGKDVFYSQGGKLLRTRFSKIGKRVICEPPSLLGDFTDMKFEPIVTPKWAKVW